MKELILVFVGGGIGSIFRYSMGKMISYVSFPVHTLVANILAALVFGVVMGGIITKTSNDPLWKLILLTGFCGGLSTFSTFNYEIFEMFKAGQLILAGLYIVSSISFCLLAYWMTTIVFSN